MTLESLLYLFLSLLSSLSIAVMLKVFEKKGGERVVIIAANYILALVVGYILSDKVVPGVPVLGFGMVLGLLFFIVFVMYSRAMNVKGITSAVTMGRLSLAIPVTVSILLWGEKPSILDIIALIVVFFIILYWEGKIGKLSLILFGLFFLSGLLDSALKYFKMNFPQVDDGFFLVIIYGSAMAWSWSYIGIRKIKPGFRDIGRGLLLGVPNFFSSYFILKALQTVPAYVTFPLINVGMIILSSLIGAKFFDERLGRKKIILVVLGIIAVLLLTI